MFACKKNVSFIRLPILKNEYTNETNPDKYMTSFYKELLDFNHLCHHHTTQDKSDSTETFLVWKTLKEIDQHLMHLKLMDLIDKKLETNKTKRDNFTQTDFNDEIIANKQENVAQIEAIQNEAKEESIEELSPPSLNENSANKEEVVEENSLKEEINVEKKEKIDLNDLPQNEVKNEINLNVS